MPYMTVNVDHSYSVETTTPHPPGRIQVALRQAKGRTRENQRGMFTEEHVSEEFAKVSHDKPLDDQHVGGLSGRRQLAVLVRKRP